MPETTTARADGETVNVMLVSAHDWFASALQAVLEPEGFVFARVRSARIALRDAALIDPDLVILDEGLPDLGTPDLASALSGGALKASVPILVYSPTFWHESGQADAMRAGAWDIIKEPVRSTLVVAKLRRLLEIKSLIEAKEDDSLSDASTGLFNLAGLMRMMRILGSAAQRHNESLSCAVIGPSEQVEPEALDDLRERAARFLAGNLRESDVCGWVGDADIGVVAYGADAAGVTALIRRLNERARVDPEAARLQPISAGVVELTPLSGDAGDTVPGARVAPVATQITSLSRFAAAQSALREARAAGGGIRIAEPS